MTTEEWKSVEQALGNEIMDILEKNDIGLCGIGKYSDNEPCVELEWYSPEGEDFIITVPIKDKESFVSVFSEQADDFDAEDHAAEWYNHRNDVSGVPQSLKALLRDAEAIKEFLENVSQQLSEVDLGKTDKQAQTKHNKANIERD
jgi:hypothetical protein